MCGYAFRAVVSPLSSSGLTGRLSIPEAVEFNREVSGILDRPLQCAIAHKPDDDTEGEDTPPHSRGAFFARVIASTTPRRK